MYFNKQKVKPVQHLSSPDMTDISNISIRNMSAFFPLS